MAVRYTVARACRPECGVQAREPEPQARYARAMGLLRALRRDVSLSAVVAGFVIVLVSYSSSLVIVLEAAKAAELDAARTASWVWAISIGSGVSGLVLTAFTRTPIICAWSTPGAALLIASIRGFSFEEAVGAFLLASAAATLFGLTGWFGWLMRRVPAPVLQALLAGVLLPFIISAMTSFASAPLIAGAIAATFFVGKRLFDRYAVLAALVVGLVIAAVQGGFGDLEIALSPTAPIFTAPAFTLQAAVSIALPLFVITMAAQNAPGLALLRMEGYRTNDRLLVGGVSALGTALAPFGSHAINLAAITAAIGTSAESHPHRERRYIAGLVAGIAYIAIGTMSSQLTAIFQAVPGEAITMLAAVALLGSTLAALKGAVTTDPRTGVAALVTLAVTMSGVVILGAGSAFWGLLAGGALALLLRTKQDRSEAMAAGG